MEEVHLKGGMIFGVPDRYGGLIMAEVHSVDLSFHLPAIQPEFRTFRPEPGMDENSAGSR